jgi:hypothetical protein
MAQRKQKSVRSLPIRWQPAAVNRQAVPARQPMRHGMCISRRQSERLINLPGLLAAFGERQVMAQLVASRSLVFSLAEEDFEFATPTRSGDFTSAALNYQKRPRAQREPRHR